MTMTRAEQARALHQLAVILENDSGFHERYRHQRSASDRRQTIRSWAVKLNGRDGEQVTDSLFMTVDGQSFMSREYLRRYFDITLSMPEASDDNSEKDADPRARVSRSKPFEFWLDREQWPGQVRAGEPRPQPQPQEQSAMLKITTKTLINNVDIAEKTNDQLFDAIAQAEAEIAKLQAIQSKPKALVAKIEELQAGIAALVAHMDAKV